MTVSAEAAPSRVANGRRAGSGLLAGRRGWVLLLVVALVASTLSAGVGGDVVNTSGWPNFANFWSAMVQPDLSPTFLEIAARAAATTLSYALLGTLLSLLIGLVGAPLLAARSWEVDGRAGRSRRVVREVLRRLVRGLDVVPRGVNEIVWALILAEVLGTAPLVAVLAIGLPFGAVTASVFADTLDEADARPYRQLRANGAGRLVSLVYGVAPIVRSDLVAYGWYRFECAVRAAAILGVVGAGGLGYQIDLSFQSLRYNEMWTMIWALVLVSVAADTVSSRARRRDNASIFRCGDVRVPVSLTVRTAMPTTPERRAHVRWAVALIVAVAASWWWVRLDPSVAWEERRVDLFGDVVGEMFPPRLGPGGWSALGSASLETVAMSLLAIAFSATVGLVLAILGARSVAGDLPRGGDATSFPRLRRQPVAAACVWAHSWRGRCPRRCGSFWQPWFSIPECGRGWLRWGSTTPES